MPIVPSPMKTHCLSLSALAAALWLSSAAFANDDVTNSITSLITRSAPSGKLATKTEVIAERGEPAMLTLSSHCGPSGLDERIPD
jgi:ABC-type Zn2+ transport system substrate-binding protein/surface adhesin